MFNYPCSTKTNFWSHWKIVICIWRGTWRTGSAWRLAITAACILCPLNAGTSCVWILSAWIRHLNFTNLTLLRCKWVPGTLWEICARCTIVLMLPTLHNSPQPARTTLMPNRPTFLPSRPTLMPTHRNISANSPQPTNRHVLFYLVRHKTVSWRVFKPISEYISLPLQMKQKEVFNSVRLNKNKNCEGFKVLGNDTSFQTLQFEPSL